MLPFRAVLRGSIARFLPASLISIAAFLVLLGRPLTERAAGPALWWGAKIAVALTVGNLAGLVIIRRLLPPVAAIDGWRSLVAGLVSPLRYCLVGSLGRLSTLHGAGSTLLDGWVYAGSPSLGSRTLYGGLRHAKASERESRSHDRTAIRPDVP